VRRILAAAALAIAIAATWTGTLPRAAAHAALEGSDPENGALLDAPPQEIRLAFTEAPDLALTTIEVVDRSGTPVPTGDARPVAGADQEIRFPLDPVPDGVYTVSWRTVSTVDGHVTSGAFSFGIGVAPEEVAPVEPEEGEQTPPPTALAVAGRWGLYVGLAVLFGGAILGLLVFGPPAVARPWLLALAWALAAAGVIVITLEERAAIGVPLGTLLDSDSGAGFIRLGVAVAVAGLAILAVGLRPGTATLLFLAAASGAAISVRATGGHAGPSTFQAILQGVHFAAVGAWIGGLAWLVAARRDLSAERARHYSNLAGVGLATLVLTGVLRATDELGGPGWWLHAFDTDYGTTLVVKLAIVVPLVALGAVNRYRNVRRYEQLGRRPLLRTVGGELVLAAGVLAMTGILTGLPPQGVEAPAPPRAPEPLVATGSDFATTTKVRLEISPGMVGPNAFVAEVTDYDTGEPVDARRVTLAFALPDRPEVGSELELELGQDGTWQAAGTALSIDGTWSVDVLVEGPSGSVEVPLEVTPIPPEQRIEVSRQEGQPDLYTIFLDDEVTIQAYVDPGGPGRTNQVHVTAFDAEGAELPLASAVLSVAGPHGQPFEPELMWGGPGHAIANVDIHAGTWRFDVVAETEDGVVLVASFEQTFQE
jgi:copper transport protein